MHQPRQPAPAPEGLNVRTMTTTTTSTTTTMAWKKPCESGVASWRLGCSSCSTYCFAAWFSMDDQSARLWTKEVPHARIKIGNSTEQGLSHTEEKSSWPEEASGKMKECGSIKALHQGKQWKVCGSQEKRTSRRNSFRAKSKRRCMKAELEKKKFTERVDERCTNSGLLPLPSK